MIVDCNQCLYWRKVSRHTGEGECHRHAPQPDGNVSTAYWPATLASDWCGDGDVDVLRAL